MTGQELTLDPQDNTCLIYEPFAGLSRMVNKKGVIPVDCFPQMEQEHRFLSQHRGLSLLMISSKIYY